jgi:hypothetical protein
MSESRHSHVTRRSVPIGCVLARKRQPATCPSRTLASNLHRSRDMTAAGSSFLARPKWRVCPHGALASAAGQRYRWARCGAGPIPDGAHVVGTRTRSLGVQCAPPSPPSPSPHDSTCHGLQKVPEIIQQPRVRRWQKYPCQDTSVIISSLLSSFKNIRCFSFIKLMYLDIF